ncbi:zinc finger, CCHC-type containing protein [Tanacetum coccineum]|uniref:Zinc finger, CCHC-type containing protein n=1 Tax=Tanacetum coccineum TaxID=301880 RepID=A0ABQ4X0H6_9ASTR
MVHWWYYQEQEGLIAYIPWTVTRNTLKGRKQLGEYQTGWKIKTGNVLDSCNQMSTQQCMKSGVAKYLGVAWIQQSPSSAIRFKTPIDMLRFFGWLASIKQGMLKPVVLYKNMGFNESGEYKKTFIDSGVGTGSVQVLQGVEFEVEPQEDHTFEVEPHGNVNHVVGSQEVQTQDLIYYHSARDREQHSAWELFSYREDNNEAAFAVAVVDKIYTHESLTFNNTVACEVISKWKARLKDDMDAQSDVYVLSNGCRKCSDDSDGYYWEYTPGMFIHLFLYIDDMVFSCGCKAEIWATKGLLDKAKGNVLGMEIVRDQSGNTLRVSQSRFYNGKLVQTLLEGHSILSLEGSLSGDCDVEKNGKWSCIYAVGSQEYQMVCTRLDIASADVGMLDKFDRGLQTDVQVFVDFGYAMGRLITVMGRSITMYRFELRSVVGIATSSLLKAVPNLRFQHSGLFSTVAPKDSYTQLDPMLHSDPQMYVSGMPVATYGQERPQLASTSNVNRPSISNHGPYDTLLLMHEFRSHPIPWTKPGPNMTSTADTLSRSQAIREPTYDPNDLGRRPGGSQVIVPDGYSSNISRGVSMKDHKISNLKSHDGHILMQDVLPIALRASVMSRTQSRVVKAVTDYCFFFNGVVRKIMVYLTIHLIYEAKVGGPVHYRWMYPVERYLMQLKSYVRNKAQPEGSIVEGYIKEECLNFCSRYFEGVETPFNRPPRNDENVVGKEIYMFNSSGRKLGKVKILKLDGNSLAQAHCYVLLNHSKIQPFRDVFLSEKQALRDTPMDSKTIEKLTVDEFLWWLKNHVYLLQEENLDEEVLSLAIGPNIAAKQYKGFITNGYRFFTRQREEFKKTQNSRVVVEVEGRYYYGKLTNIIELEYYRGYKIVLFQCDWVDNRLYRGLKKDKYGFPLVNFSRPLVHTGENFKDDPFIISTQARQVFYIEDLKDVGWSHVIMTKPRDIYDIGTNVNRDDDDSYTQCMPCNLPIMHDVNQEPHWRRRDSELQDA